MAQHTKGPWTAHVKDFGQCHNRPYVTVGSNDAAIAAVFTIDCTDRPIDEYEANARLIASAPDLLEALEDIMEATEDWHGDPRMAVARRKARKAIIAYAKGESK